MTKAGTDAPPAPRACPECGRPVVRVPFKGHPYTTCSPPCAAARTNRLRRERRARDPDYLAKQRVHTREYTRRNRELLAERRRRRAAAEPPAAASARRARARERYMAAKAERDADPALRRAHLERRRRYYKARRLEQRQAAMAL